MCAGARVLWTPRGQGFRGARGRGCAVFGTEIVCYLFLGGAGAGACFVLAVMGLLVPRAAIVRAVLGGRWPGRARATLRRSGTNTGCCSAPASRPRASLALALGVVFLLADVGRVDQLLLLLDAGPACRTSSVGAYALGDSASVLAAVLALAWGGWCVGWRMRLLVVLAGGRAAGCGGGHGVHGAAAAEHARRSAVAFALAAGAVRAVVRCRAGWRWWWASASSPARGIAFASVMRRAVALDAAVIVLEALVAALLVATVALGAQASEPSGTMVAAAQSGDPAAGAGRAPACSGAGSWRWAWWCRSFWRALRSRCDGCLRARR